MFSLFKAKKQEVVSPLPEKDLLEISRHIKENKGVIGKTLSNAEMLDIKSTSLSILLKGDLILSDKIYPSFVKIGFPSTEVFFNNDVVENDIYKEIIPSLSRFTPHLLNFYGSYSTNKIMLPSNIIQPFNKKLVAFQKSGLVQMNEPNFLFLERTSGSLLYYYVQKASNSSILEIMFQVFYTLKCFHSFNMVHLDLHDANIFVDSVKRKTIYYHLNKKTYKLQTDVFAKIFDFDRSRVYNPNISRNFKLDFSLCSGVNQCNEFDSTFDAYYFLSSIYIILYGFDERKPILDTISKLISTDVVLKDHLQGKYFRIKTRKEQTCKSIDDCLQEIIPLLVKERKLEIVEKEEGYLYRIPERKIIRDYRPDLQNFPSQEMDIDEFPESLEDNPTERMEVFTSVANRWKEECYHNFGYDLEENIQILKKAYNDRHFDLLGKFSPEQKEVYNLIYNNVFIYLSIPMFYGMNLDQVSEVLVYEEILLLQDIIHTIGAKLPIEIPNLCKTYM